MGRPDGKHLGEFERGFHSPTITTAKQIADALEVRLEVVPISARGPPVLPASQSGYLLRWPP